MFYKVPLNVIFFEKSGLFTKKTMFTIFLILNNCINNYFQNIFQTNVVQLFTIIIYLFYLN